MKTEIIPCSTESEIQEAQRLRYEIYVEEMGRYRHIADHEKRLLVEPEDSFSRHYLCLVDGKLSGTMRHTWGGDSGLSDRQIGQYTLRESLPFCDDRDMVIGERFMVRPEYRGTRLLFDMFSAFLKFANEHRIQLIIGDCEPHLLNLYLGLGFQTYSRSNINSKETGYLIPLLFVVEDVEYLRRVGSPLVDQIQDFGSDNRIPEKLSGLISSSAVLNQRIAGDSVYWSSIYGALESLPKGTTSIFNQLSDQEIRLLIDKSSIIECRRGDHLIKQGNVTNNLFVILSGLLEVRDEGNRLAIISPGEMLGEMAFLLNIPRTKDIYAMSDDVRVLSVSETVLRGLIENHPNIAARLLLSISKILCVRLAKMHS
ncbi:MAG: hypothetical protein ACI8P9_004437 [Parasphingorhabdus sp.]|jgi:hypothetical protein